MFTKLAFVYPWATHGGVEKVLINRAKLFGKYNDDYHVDILFTHDSGALKSISLAVADCKNIEVKIIELSSLSKENYDCIFCIDFPAAINFCHENRLKYIVECHTAYRQNRTYLNTLPDSCSAILCPSPLFLEELKPEVKNAPCPTMLLSNCIPWDIKDVGYEEIPNLPKWSKRPLLFLGRMDKLKNVTELMDAFVHLKVKRPDEFMLVLCGPQSPEINVNEELERRGLIGDTVIFPPIPFFAVESFLLSFANTGGIFISPSTGESFGLSASEAICSDIPVMLSDIEAHKALVKGKEAHFIYPLHDSEMLAEKLETLSFNYKQAKSYLSELKEKFSSHTFIQDWAILAEYLKVNK